MYYQVNFLDNKFRDVSSWLHDINCNFKLQINDKVIIDESSFERNLFDLDAYQSIVEILNNSITNYDKEFYSDDSFGEYYFEIIDIEYLFDDKTAWARIYLKKI